MGSGDVNGGFGANFLTAASVLSQKHTKISSKPTVLQFNITPDTRFCLIGTHKFWEQVCNCAQVVLYFC